MHRSPAFHRPPHPPRARVATLRRAAAWNDARMWAVLLAVVLLLASTARAARAAGDPVTASAASVKVKAGQSAAVALKVVIAPGWHVFGPDPNVDGVRPAALAAASAAGLTAGPVKMPAARKVRVEALNADANVYEGTVTIAVTVKADAKAAPGPRTLDATLSYQACGEKQCLMPKKLVVKLPVVVTK